MDIQHVIPDVYGETDDLRFRTLAETTTATIFIIQGSQIHYVNPAAEITTGYTLAELHQMNFWEVIHPELQGVAQRDGLARQQGKPIPPRREMRLLTKNGEERWVDVTLATMEFRGKPAVLGTAFDITQRKQAEAETIHLTRKLIALQYAGATIACSLELSHVLNTFTQEMAGLMEADACIIYEWCQADDTIAVIADYGLAVGNNSLLATIYNLADFPAMKRVLAKPYTRQMTISETVITPIELNYMRTFNIKTWLMVPMEFQGRVIGSVAVIDTRLERRFTLEELALAQFLANQAASAIENAHLYAQAQHEIAERIQAEHELRQSEAKNRALLDAMPDLMFRVTAEGVFLDFHSSNSNDLLAPPEMFLGKNISEVMPPSPSQLILGYITQTLAWGQIQVFEYQLPLPQGFQDFEARLVPSGPDEVLAIIRNITDRKQAEKALQARTYELGERVKELGCLYRVSKLIETKGDELETIFKETTELLPPAWQYPYITCARITLEGQEFKTENFRETPWQLKADLIVFGQRVGTVEVGYLEEKPRGEEWGFLREENNLLVAIAERLSRVVERIRAEAARQQAEQALRESEERLKFVLIGSQQGLWDWNIETGEVKRNERWAEILGYTLAEIEFSAKQWTDLLHPDDRAAAWQSIQDHLAGRTPMHQMEYRMLTKDGQYKWIIDRARVVERDPQGRPTRMSGTHTDITDRKRTEEALQKSEANLRAIFDNSAQPFMLIDREHRVQAFNKIISAGIQLVLGEKIKEGDSIYDFAPAMYVDEFNQKFTQALNGSAVTAEIHIKVGDIDGWYELRYTPVLMPGDRVIGVCFSAIDIGEYKKAVDTLAESEARLLAEMRSALMINRALVSEIDPHHLLELIMTQAQHLTYTDGTAVLLLSNDGLYLEAAPPSTAWLNIKPEARLPVQGSLAGLVLDSRHVRFNNQPQHDAGTASIREMLKPAQIHSILCAPLVAQDKNLGVLLIWNEHEQLFFESDSRLTSLFADQAALALHNAQLHARNRQLAIEQERHRLARELHDSVTQSLYSMGLAAETSLRLLGQDTAGEARRPIEYIQTLAKTTLTEMREQLYQLQPTGLQDGLVKALTRHCAALTEQYALTIEFIPEAELSLPAMSQESLYYIVREALWNIVKHASATQVKIKLTRKNDRVVLSIKDNGTGFNLSDPTAPETMGLKNMAERAKLLDGTFKLQSKPGEGTHLTVQIPIQPY